MKCALLIFLVIIHNCVGIFQTNMLNFTDIMSRFNISQKCYESVALMYLNVIGGNTEDTWGLQLFDATSKIPVGLLFSYNFGELGDFTLCLGTESLDKSIKGKYCLGSIPISALSVKSERNFLEKQMHARKMSKLLANIKTRNADIDNNVFGIGPTWAICLPNQCSDDDASNILFNLIGSPSAICQTRENLSPPLTTGANVTIVILFCHAFIMVASTGYELFCIYRHIKPSHDVFLAFSMYNNGKRLFKISRNTSELSCLNGIRFISMLWVIIGHLYNAVSSVPMVNMKSFLDWIESLRSMVLISATLSVDTFFVVGGALVVYVFMKSMYKGVKFNIFHYYIHRYIRLTPAVAALMLVSATLLTYLGSGPYWNYIELNIQQPCVKNWWVNFLYLQNYINADAMCLGHTWYLSVDMQLYVLSPLILYPLWKNFRIGLLLLTACVVASIIVPFYIAYSMELSGILSNFYPKTPTSVMDYMYKYYYVTHARAAPYLIGACLGYFLFRVKYQNAKIPQINKVILTLIWIACLAFMLTCIYGGHSTLRGIEYDRLGNSFYIALVRPAWSVCIAWVIFACVVDYGGPINTILSLPIYQVLNRFTYSTYLLHLLILYLKIYASKTGTRFSELDLAYSFWGIFMFSFGLSIIWVLAFESPMMMLEKIIFKSNRKT